MQNSYDEYSPHFIHTVLQYRKGVRGYGLGALAKKFNIKGGKKLISYWLQKWDTTESSLMKQSGGDTRSILTNKEKKVHVYDFVDKKRQVEAATYEEVKRNVEKKTKKTLSLTTVKRAGKSRLKLARRSEKESSKVKVPSLLNSRFFACFYLSNRHRKLSEFCYFFQKKVSACC
jgi:hypothetical protein